MSTINGCAVILKITDGNNAVAVAGQKDASITLSADTVDTTTKDSNGWKENDVSFKSWEASLDGLVKLQDNGFKKVADAFYSDTPISVEIAYPGGEKETGNAIITSIEKGLPLEDKVSYSIALTGSGPLTRAASQSNLKENK